MKNILLIIIMLALSLPLRAADKYVRITTDEGLQSNYITSICRSSLGFVWIGTAEGLSRYDGVSIKQYDFLDETGTPSLLRINCIVCDNQSGPLVTTNKGLYIYDNLLDCFNLLYSSQRALYGVLDTPKYIFMGSDNGLVVKNKESSEILNLLISERILSLEQSGNNIYILTTSKLYAMSLPVSDSEVAFEFRLLEELPQGNYSCIAVDDRVVYLGTDRFGVLTYDILSNKKQRLSNVDARIIRRLSIQNSMLYIATDGDGVIEYDTNRGEIVARSRDNETFISSSVTCLDVDDKNIFWLGSYSTGVYFSQPVDDFISLVPATSGVSVRSVCRVSDERYIIGSRDGLLLWHNGNTKLFNSEEYPVIQSNIILSITPYVDNKYIVGTFGGGVFVVDEQRGEVMSLNIDSELSSELEYESIYDMAYLGGDLYFFTLKGIIRYSSKRGVESWNRENSKLPSSLIYSKCYDPKRDIFWVGTANGLCKFDIATSTIIPIDLKSMTNDFRINVITLDGDDNLFIDKNYIDLYSLNTPTMESVKVNFAANSADHISGVVVDDNLQYLWIATTNGLYRYNTWSNQSVKFMHQSGLKNTNICPNAIHKFSKDRIFVGTEDGFYWFESQQAVSEKSDHTIHLTSAKINGVESLQSILNRSTDIIDKQRQYIIAVNHNDAVEFEVVDPAFLKVQEYKYAVCIGSSGEWQYLESNYFELNDDLPVGRYQIMVKIVHDDYDDWGEPIIVGYLIIGLSTSTILLIGVIILSLVLYAIFWRKIRKIIVRKRRKNRRINNFQPRDEDITNKRSKQVMDIIRSSLEKDQAYKNPKFRLSDLSELTKLSSSEISQVLNKDLNISFVDFINDYRVEEVKKLLAEDDANYYILHVLAERCGFNSKTSFYRIFKNKTGVTPLQYRRQVVQSTKEE